MRHIIDVDTEHAAQLMVDVLAKQWNARTDARSFRYVHIPRPPVYVSSTPVDMSYYRILVEQPIAEVERLKVMAWANGFIAGLFYKLVNPAPDAPAVRATLEQINEGYK